MSYTKPKKKTNPAIWQRAFPDQAKALRPERTAAGGVKARSGSEKVRMEVYGAIADLFKKAHPVCECWGEMAGCAVATEDVHHTRGRAGLLLFDIRHFLPVCRPCHDWIGAHPEEAAAKGWLA